MRPLRISAISYLNTAPLTWDFEHGEAGGEFEISYTLPSACARALEAGTADIGIIPAAAYTQVPGLVVLPGVAIASRRPVRSILLVSNMPVEKIRTVALDTSSMTSVALTKILFEKWLGGGRTFTSMAPNIEKMLAQHDAALVIGDPALQIDRSRYLTLDLAEEWIRHTGKPFVFAFWAVRQDALQEDQSCGDGRIRPSAVRVAKRRQRVAGSSHNFPAIPRPRTRAGKPRSDYKRMGAKARAQARRCSLLPHRKHLLPLGPSVSRRPATFLSLCGRDRRAARRARDLFSSREHRGCLAQTKN